MSHLKCRPRRRKIKLLFNDGLFGRVAGRLQQLTTKQTFQFLKPIYPSHRASSSLLAVLFCLWSIIRMNGFKDKKSFGQNIYYIVRFFFMTFYSCTMTNSIWIKKSNSYKSNDYKHFSKSVKRKKCLQRSSACRSSLFINL